MKITNVTMGKTKLNVSLVRKAAMKEIRDNGMSPRAKAYLEFLHDWYKAETRDDDKGLS